MIAKALDEHTSRFGDALTYRVRNRSCKNDADCSLGHCLVECNTAIGEQASAHTQSCRLVILCFVYEILSIAN